MNALDFMRRCALVFAFASLFSLCANGAMADGSAPSPSTSPAPAYGIGRVVRDHGYPEFDVDGKPFLMFGAAFFYDRLPRDSWDDDMKRIRDLGFNTLDLYVPWNWHELADGDFDFDGRTNPRRDLREVIRLAKLNGFYLIVRPGPVIRNEWKNGGYPQWLLERPEYGMPLRDVLEGRYPATATLQNAHSDDAAAQWMHNATHMRYAERWLVRALHEFDPVADRVLAVALDDDQGAYIDNQTWPAPHLQAYLEALRGTVLSVTGPNVPTFINTYQMKVPASSHVWAMGNWYQSDAYAIGEHDRSQLEFSTGLLETRPGQPIWTSEFQAGWLEQPQDVIPHAADPTNTILALGTMLQSGTRGVVDFPAQDSLAPAGYEAPFSNAFYSWDAALGYPEASDGPDAPRYSPTARFGGIVRAFGPDLAATHVAYDATIAWLGSAFDPGSMTNADFSALADRTLEAQRACRLAGLTCRLVDLRFATDGDLAKSKLLLLPRPNDGDLAGRPFDRAISSRVGALVRSGLPVASLVHDATIDAGAIGRVMHEAGRVPVVANGIDSVFAASDTDPDRGFLTVVNYESAPAHHAGMSITTATGRILGVPAFDVAPRSVVVSPIGIALRTYAPEFAPRDKILWSDCPIGRIETPTPDSVRFVVDRHAPACAIRVELGGVARTLTFGDASAVTIGSTGIVSTTSEIWNGELPERIVGATFCSCGKSPNGYLIDPSYEEHVPIDRGVVIPVRGLETSAYPPNVRAFYSPNPFPADQAKIYQLDLYRDGFPVVVLQNDRVRVVVSPSAGGRAFDFQDLSHDTSAFDSVGALRDDVAIQPPLSTSDRIAKYTHQFPAGFFNRPYAVTVLASGPRASVRLTYSAPDAFPNGATFARTLTLLPHSRDLVVDETASFEPGTVDGQHGVAISSLAVGDPRAPTTQHVVPEGTTFAMPLAGGVVPGTGLFDSVSDEAILIVSSAGMTREFDPSDTPHTLVVTANLDPSATTRTIFRYDYVSDLATAQADLGSLEAELAHSTAVRSK